MTVTAKLRYMNKVPTTITITQEVPEGTTAGTFSDVILTAHEKQEKIQFTGANVAVLIGGRIVTKDYLLKDGDEVLIIPVAAGG